MSAYDMHCHLGFADNAVELARSFVQQGVWALSATVEPTEYVRMRELLAEEAAVRIGVGLHPWWLSDGRCDESDVEACLELVREERFVAEVGLDLGKRCAFSRDIQLSAFERICAVAGEVGGKVLSLHAVNAAQEVLDVLERTGCLAPVAGGAPACACILHWYSGSSDQLQRAVRLGCFFSINPRMLQTKRGREYARILPADRLLLETDLPPSEGGDFGLGEIPRVLAQTLDALEALRGESLASRIAATSRRLLTA